MLVFHTLVCKFGLVDAVAQGKSYRQHHFNVVIHKLCGIQFWQKGTIFAIGFPYKHFNFWPLCLPVKMAPKTVIKYNRFLNLWGYIQLIISRGRKPFLCKLYCFMTSCLSTATTRGLCSKWNQINWSNLKDKRRETDPTVWAEAV